MPPWSSAAQARRCRQPRRGWASLTRAERAAVLGSREGMEAVLRFARGGAGFLRPCRKGRGPPLAPPAGRGPSTLVVSTGAEAAVRGLDGGASFGTPPSPSAASSLRPRQGGSALSPQAGRGGSNPLAVSPSRDRQLPGDGRDDPRIVGVDRVREGGAQAAVPGDEVLVEVPARRRTGLLRGRPAVERVGVDPFTCTFDTTGKVTPKFLRAASAMAGPSSGSWLPKSGEGTAITVRPRLPNRVHRPWSPTNCPA